MIHNGCEIVERYPGNFQITDLITHRVVATRTSADEAIVWTDQYRAGSSLAHSSTNEGR